MGQGEGAEDLAGAVAPECRIAVRQSIGQAGPVLLCHGNSLGAELFEAQLRSSLGERYRLVAIDLPGHGDSTDAPSRYPLESLVSVILELLDTLELFRPVLVGHSLGGHLLAQAASRVPGCRGLLIAGTPLLPSAMAVSEAFHPHPALGLLFQAELDEAERRLLLELLSPASPGSASRVERLLCRADPRFRSALAAAVGGGYPDEVALVRALDAPVAILHGARDAVVNLDYVKRLHLPNLWRGAVQILDGAGHMAHLDIPERFNALLGAFLEDVC